ncbi:hypothetical protein [Solimicrobium silvestre]|nr:hypothetical protein [Solimicrobium silvestre]
MARNSLIITITLTALAFIAVCLMYCFADPMTVIVDSEHVTGITGAGFAFGGVLMAIVAVVLCAVFVSLILAGVSVFLIALFAALFIGGLVLLSPLLFPALLVIGLIMLFHRKKPHHADAAG